MAQLRAGTKRVVITVDGRNVEASEGETLVTAMLRAGFDTFQINPKSGTLRGPFCLMGACQDCRVLVNGTIALGCLTLVEHGLEVRRLTSAGATP